MSDFKMQLIGSDELRKRLENATKIIQTEVRANVQAGAQDISSEAKQRAPVDKGILKNLISAAPATDTQDGFQSIVTSGADYSAYVEFGTGTKVSVPVDLADFAIQFKGIKSIKGQRAQPFFFPSAKRIRPIIEANIQKSLEKI